MIVIVPRLLAGFEAFFVRYRIFFFCSLWLVLMLVLALATLLAVHGRHFLSSRDRAHHLLRRHKHLDSLFRNMCYLGGSFFGVQPTAPPEK